MDVPIIKLISTQDPNQPFVVHVRPARWVLGKLLIKQKALWLLC